MNPSGHIVVIRRDGTDGLTCDWCSPLCDIGSNQSCDIRVQHSTVAPFHCTLQLMGNGLVQAVSRVDGKYKMLVNDFPLKDACVLTNNSVLTVGDRQFRFLYPSIRKLTTGDYLCETSYQTPIYHGKEEILTPNSLPVVYPSKRSSSKRNPPDSAVRSPRQRSTTPKRTLGTSERYGPVPPRQPATPPIIQVLRHEPNSSQTMHPYQFRTENEESTKQNATYGCYEGMEVSKSRRLSNQPKSCTISNFSISTSPPSSKLSSSIKVGPHDHIQTSVTPSLPSDGLNCTTKKNSSPGFRKSFHKLLILNESSKHSKLCDVDQLYDELSCVQQNSIENKNLPPNRQRNQLFYGESLNNSIEKSSHDSIPEMLTSPSSSITTRKSSVNSSRKINVACSLETVQKSDYRSNKRTIVDKIYSAADDKPTPKRRRGVSFGPPLSPEQFDKSLPPSTPVKRGETPLAKLSHSTPACHNLQTTPVVPRQATPFSSKAKLSQISQLSIFSETTLESPNYNTTNNRVSAVISLPPTPDTNLLNSLSTNSSYPSTSVAAYPVTSAAYSAPIKTSVNRLTFKRRSLGFAETPDKTPSPKVPPTSPASNKPIKRHRLKYRQQNTKQLGKRARSLHFPINKPNTKTRYKKNYISVPDLTLEKQIRKRRRDRSSSVPPTQLSETEPSTPNKSLLSASKSSGLTGVRKLMRTPKPMETPRISGVSELFVEESIGKRRRGRPSSVPPTQLSETEPSTPNKSLLSASKSSGLTGVRKLMRTPKPMETPRVSGVRELFVEHSTKRKTRECASRVKSVIVGSSTGLADFRFLVPGDDIVPVSNVEKFRCLRHRVVDLNVKLFPSNHGYQVTKIPDSPKSLSGITRNIKDAKVLSSSQDTTSTKRNRFHKDMKRAAELSTNDWKFVAGDYSIKEPKPSKSAVKRVSPLPVGSSIIAGNRSRKKKRLSLASKLTPGKNLSSVKSLYLEMKSNGQSSTRERSMSNESNDIPMVSSVPMAKRVGNRIVKSDVKCVSSSRPQRGKKVSESVKKKSVLGKSTVKGPEVQTSIKVASLTNISAASRQPKNKAACKSTQSTTDLKYSFPPQGQLFSAVKSSNNQTSKKSTKRLSEIHKASSFPAEKRLRRRIVQLNVERLTSEEIQDGGETSLYVNKGSIKKKSTIKRANMLRNHESITPAASVTGSSTSLISKDSNVDKIRAYSRRNKRPSVTSVDNVARVSPKRRTLRPRKIITSDIVLPETTSQPLQESLPMSKTTRRKQTRTNTSNSSVLTKSSPVKITTPVRQTRSRLRQISHTNK